MSLVQKPLVVTIEGIVAAGKSTLLSKIQKHVSPVFRIHIVPEPIEAWENVKLFDCYNQNFQQLLMKNGGMNTQKTDLKQYELLSQMYLNRERWSFSFQVKYACVFNLISRK